MTAQASERLMYQGQQRSMQATPLGVYFNIVGHYPKFILGSSALWRRYIGSWEIIDDRLYLVGLEATLEDGSPASLETFFPGYPDRVFAHWYTDDIQLREGELIQYDHMGFNSIYERDLFLDIERGVVVGTRMRHNKTDGPKWGAQRAEKQSHHMTEEREG